MKNGKTSFLIDEEYQVREGFRENDEYIEEKIHEENELRDAVRKFTENKMFKTA